MNENHNEREARIFAAGYMLGGRHGYSAAVEESYPELQEGQTEVGLEVDQNIKAWYSGKYRPTDPSEDFAK